MQTTEVFNSFVTPIRHQSSEDQGYRQFVIEQADAVALPDCVSIDSVRLNGHEMTPFTDHDVPTDTTDRHFKTVRVPTYRLVEGPNGVPQLLRSLNSNDGKWQLGSRLSVKGTWKTPNPTSTNSDGLDSMNQAQLKIKAAELGLPDYPVGTKNVDIVAAIRAKLAGS